MRLLLTGGSGFVGTNLFPLLLENDHIESICIVCRDFESFGDVFDSPKVSYSCIDKDGYIEKIKNFDPSIVLHLASFLTSRDDTQTMKKLVDANIVFGTMLLDALKECSVTNFINFGTCTEYLYGNGELQSAYLYSATKTAYRSILKYYAESYKFNIVNIIPYTIYGGKDSQKKVLDYIYSSLDSKEQIEMSGGEQILDFVHLKDVLNFIVTTLEKCTDISKPYSEFHLGSGKGTSIKDVAKLLECVTGKSAIVSWGALPYRPNDLMHAVAPIGKNIELLNWFPQVDLEEGLRLYVNEKENE